MDEILYEVLKMLDTKKGINTYEEKRKVIREKINKAYEQPCKISIKKNGKMSEGADCMIVGDYLAVLVTLAGLEKAILEKLGSPTELWEAIKEMTSVEEAENE